MRGIVCISAKWPNGASNEFVTSPAGDLVHSISSWVQVGVCDRAVCSCACVLGVVREGLSQREGFVRVWWERACLSVKDLSATHTGRPSGSTTQFVHNCIKDDFQSVLHSLSTLMFINIVGSDSRWWCQNKCTRKRSCQLAIIWGILHPKLQART